ncbi:hypothetical protein K8I28_02835 [bacterium]|nr:hypothetical protein [bacterium]
MSVWFEGSNEIDCNIQKVKLALENLGEHFTDVVSLMPGMKQVELVEDGKDFVTIKTNEGLMKRTNISRRIEEKSVAVEFDEEYRAGRMVSTHSHFIHEFNASSNGVSHGMVISNVAASGFLGFLYRKLGKSNMGKAFLKSYKTYFEESTQ